jgi:hypothetical protein
MKHYYKEFFFGKKFMSNSIGIEINYPKTRKKLSTWHGIGKSKSSNLTLYYLNAGCNRITFTYYKPNFDATCPTEPICKESL